MSTQVTFSGKEISPYRLAICQRGSSLYFDPMSFQALMYEKCDRNLVVFNIHVPARGHLRVLTIQNYDFFIVSIPSILSRASPFTEIEEAQMQQDSTS